MLEIQKLKVLVGKKTILNDCSFTFEKNKTYAIMGPNGSGKSTLAHSVMGFSGYKMSPASKILFQKKDITKLETYKRAKLGLFLSFQSPMPLPGINVFQLMRVALQNKYDPLTLRKKIDIIAQKLHIKEELLTRPLHEDFSGGEKKKMEILQALLIDPKVCIFDEIDTGVDIDALEVISKAIHSLVKKNKTIILITHYSKILHYIKPDRVLIMNEGRIISTGTIRLAFEIEKKGYTSFFKKK